MPFINGRYHVNPIMGAALEAAREAEIRRGSASRESPPSRTTEGPLSRAAEDFEGNSDTAPIHHVEIEATEIVPSHSGRATRGYVARVHRSSSPAAALKPETHVFTNHGDLLNFLHDELSKA